MLGVGPRRHLPALALELACRRAGFAGRLQVRRERTAACRLGSWAGQRGALSLGAGREGGTVTVPWPFASLASQRSSQPSRLIAAASRLEPGPRAGFPDISGPSALSGTARWHRPEPGLQARAPPEPRNPAANVNANALLPRRLCVRTLKLPLAQISSAAPLPTDRCSSSRLSRKSALGAVAEDDASEGVSFRPARRLRAPAAPQAAAEGVSVELEEVVRRGDQSPLGADRGSASSSEAVDAAVELGVGEDRLDDRLALAVELAAAVAGEDSAHERVEAAVPTRPRAFAALGVGRDQHRDAAIDDPFHLLLMPIAGVGDAAPPEAR